MSEMHVICGPMFAGKSSKLIELAKTFTDQGLQVAAIKPAIDHRYDKADIVAHTGQRMSDVGVPIAVADINIPNISDVRFIGEFKKDNINVLLIDEAQFFTPSGIAALKILGMSASHVVVFAGLELDAFGKPFGCMGELLCEADTITKIQGVCAVCQHPSTRTFRRNINENKATVVVGGAELYESRCLEHWIDGMRDYFADQWL